MPTQNIYIHILLNTNWYSWIHSSPLLHLRQWKQHSWIKIEVEVCLWKHVPHWQSVTNEARMFIWGPLFNKLVYRLHMTSDEFLYFLASVWNRSIQGAVDGAACWANAGSIKLLKFDDDTTLRGEHR